VKVMCRKIISHTTGEDLGKSDPWLTVGNEYIILAMDYLETEGFQIYIQSENYNEPIFTHIIGFEFVSQKIPSSWITTVSNSYGRKVITMLPASWNYDSFFEDIENEEPKAVELFNQEAKKIYEEEDSLPGWSY